VICERSSSAPTEQKLGFLLLHFLDLLLSQAAQNLGRKQASIREQIVPVLEAEHSP
jgi:hypothetical protein